jgi:hypothetical protein
MKSAMSGSPLGLGMQDKYIDFNIENRIFMKII